MKILSGKAVFSGIAIGRISILQQEDFSVKRIKIQDTQKEIERVSQAKEKAVSQLRKLYEKALREVGESGAAIFEVHQMMLNDEDYLDSIRNIIMTEKVNAEYAVAATEDNFAAMFEQMDDEYMRARAADIKDISNRLIRILCGSDEENLEASEPVIVVAEDLSPSETVQMDKSKVLAFVTRKGSSNSHTAILARTMNIPALINVEYEKEINGRMAVADGRKGCLIVNPDEETIKKYRNLQEEETKKREMLKELKGKVTETKSSHKINLYANIGNPSDVAGVLANDAEGIGLFRSEFLYLENSDFPTEEQQFSAYKKVLETMAGKPVIIRTLDIGADKQADYFGLKKEENPALGMRAIRICLTRPEIFKTQLRALYRASVFGKLGIMFPMITSESEVRQILEICEEVRKELTGEGIEFSPDVELGIMIETPAAAIISDKLAPLVDFFSVGTNDLTQYTLACDRQNPDVEVFADTHHEAILRLIAMAADNAHKNGAWIGICGELAADTELSETFLRMGIDELSVAPSYVLKVRDTVRKIDLGK